jgi:hypothetical protein
MSTVIPFGNTERVTPMVGSKCAVCVCAVAANVRRQNAAAKRNAKIRFIRIEIKVAS